MAKPAAKSTALKIDISSVYTTIVAVKRLSGPDAEVQSGEINALDSGVGMEYGATGHVEGGSVRGSCYFDPVAATHQALTDLITAPSASKGFKIVWSDSANTEWPFTGIVKTFTPSAEFNQFLMADFSIKLNGMVTYPT